MKALINVWRTGKRNAFFAVLVLFAGCGGFADMTSTETSPEEPYSAAEIREITVDHPQFTSGDYFRKKEPKALIADEKTSAEKGQTEKHQTADARDSAAAPTMSAASTSTPVQPPMKLKVAMLLDQRNLLANSARLLNDSAAESITEFPIVLVTPREIEDSLSPDKAIAPIDLDRVSRELSVYPGVRMLVLVERFTLPEAYPGSAHAVVSIVDAGIEHRYPPLEIAMALTAETDAGDMADAVVSTAFDKAVEHSALTPWFCRVFSHDEHAWYVNAGKESGLQVGDQLKVLTGGKLITAPSGVPAGWIPGDPKGTLKVDRHFGRDLAVCSLVEGAGPRVGDLLVK